MISSYWLLFTSSQFASQTLKTLKITPSKINLRERLWKVGRYQGGNQRPPIKEGQTMAIHKGQTMAIKEGQTMTIKKGQTMIYKTLHRKLKIDEPQ